MCGEVAACGAGIAISTVGRPYTIQHAHTHLHTYAYVLYVLLYSGSATLVDKKFIRLKQTIAAITDWIDASLWPHPAPHPCLCPGSPHFVVCRVAASFLFSLFRFVSSSFCVLCVALVAESLCSLLVEPLNCWPPQRIASTGPVKDRDRSFVQELASLRRVPPSRVFN